MEKAKEDLVSIIVPVYNAEKYLHQCIDSILAQDHEELDILLIDDGSQDGSAAIVDEYACRDSRISVFHQKNGGVGAATNVGLDHARGQYIMFVDNDDWIEPDYVSFLLSKTRENHLDIACCTGWDYYVESGREILLDHQRNCLFSDHEAVRDILSDHHFTSEAMMKKIYRASLFDHCRCLTDRHYQDTYMFLKMMPETKHWGYFNAPKYHYRVHAGSITHSGYQSYSVQQVLAYADNYKLIQERYPESLRLLEHYIVSVSMSNYIKLVVEGKQAQYPDDLKYYRDNFRKYKPIWKNEKTKVSLYACWMLYRCNPGLLDAVIRRFRRQAAAAVNVEMKS